MARVHIEGWRFGKFDAGVCLAAVGLVLFWGAVVVLVARLV